MASSLPSRTPGRKEKHWATAVNVAQWERERAQAEERTVEADTRFVVQENPVQGWVRLVDTWKVFGRTVPTDTDGTLVVEFDTDALPLDVARDLATRAKRALVRQFVA